MAPEFGSRLAKFYEAFTVPILESVLCHVNTLKTSQTPFNIESFLDYIKETYCTTYLLWFKYTAFIQVMVAIKTQYKNGHQNKLSLSIYSCPSSKSGSGKTEEVLEALDQVFVKSSELAGQCNSTVNLINVSFNSTYHCLRDIKKKKGKEEVPSGEEDIEEDVESEDEQMDLVVEWEEFEKDNYDSGEYAAPYKNDPVFSDDSDVDVCTSVAGARADIKKKIRLINCILYVILDSNPINLPIISLTFNGVNACTGFDVDFSENNLHTPIPFLFDSISSARSIPPINTRRNKHPAALFNARTSEGIVEEEKKQEDVERSISLVTLTNHLAFLMENNYSNNQSELVIQSLSRFSWKATAYFAAVQYLRTKGWDLVSPEEIRFLDGFNNS